MSTNIIYPKIYHVISQDIKPFTKENLCNISKTDFLSNCSQFKLNFGDAIQVDDQYRNHSKYYWDDGWHEMFTEHIGPYFDYGVLPKQFSVIDKQLPLDYFNNTIDYNSIAVPWDPKLQLSQIIVNTTVNTNHFTTHFMWRNKKIIISSELYHLDKSILVNMQDCSGGSFNQYDHEKKMYTDNFINYHNLKVQVNNFTVPEFLRKHIYKMYRTSDKDTHVMFSNKKKYDKTIITKYTGLQVGDIIMINTTDMELETICNNYIITKITDDNEYYNKLRLTFIDNILKSKYLYFYGEDQLTDTKTEYKCEVF